MKRSTSVAWRLAVALLLALALPAFAQRAAAPRRTASPAKNPAASAARAAKAPEKSKLPAPARYGVYLGTSRVGQMATRFEETTFEGKQVIRIGSDMSMKIEALGS